MNLYMYYIRTQALPLHVHLKDCGGHHVHFSATPHQCMFASERTTSHIGQSAVQTGTRFCIYRLRESYRDDADGLLHAWAARAEVSIRGSRPRRHISSSVRRPSLLVLLSLHTLVIIQYLQSLIKYHCQCLSGPLNTSGMYLGMHVQHIWVLNVFHLSHGDIS